MFNVKTWLVTGALIIMGCQSTSKIELGYVADVNPEHQITPTSVIAVLPLENGNVIESEKYIKKIVESMKRKGFIFTYSVSELSQIDQKADMALLVNVDTKNQVYTKSQPIYGEGVKLANGWMKYRYQPSVFKKDEIDIKESKDVHIVTLDLFDSVTKTQLLSVMGYSTAECSDRVNQILVAETLDKLRIESKKNYQYKVALPRQVTCEDS